MVVIWFVENAKNSVVTITINSGIVKADQRYVLTFIQDAVLNVCTA